MIECQLPRSIRASEMFALYVTCAMGLKDDVLMGSGVAVCGW